MVKYHRCRICGEKKAKNPTPPRVCDDCRSFTQDSKKYALKQQKRANKVKQTTTTPLALERLIAEWQRG